MLKLFFWLRYLRKKKIVFLSIAAVALSTALLIVVASLFNGFIDAFEQAAVDTIGDVVLAAPTRFAKYPLLIERLEQISTVNAATPTLSAPGLIHLGKGNVRVVEIWGIEPASRARVISYKQSLLKQKDSPGEPRFEFAGSSEKTQGFVGIGVLAEPDEATDEYDLGVAGSMIGKDVVVTTGTVAGANAGDDSAGLPPIARRVIIFTITDVVFTGVYDLDKSLVYLPIEKLQKELHPEEDSRMADRIQIKLKDDVDVETALAEIRGLWQVFAAEQLGWGPYMIAQTTIATAQQMQRQYVAELYKQMGLLLVIFGVVSFSVVVLIFCIFYMIARLKQRDVAIMKSCGAASSSVALIFVGFGCCVGIIGSGCGAALGYLITKNINAIESWIRILFGLKLWKSSVYMFSKIPSEVDWASALPIMLFAVVAATIGTLIPAIVAARTRPVEILRYE
jgi:ABC-type lipoprotein release transport system permease subunit